MEQGVDANVVLRVCAEVRATQDMHETEQEPQHVAHHSKRDVLKQIGNIQLYSTSTTVYHFPKPCLIKLLDFRICSYLNMTVNYLFLFCVRNSLTLEHNL